MKDEGYSSVNEAGQPLHGGFEWAGVVGGAADSELIWRCDAMRAGRLYNRTWFDTRPAAEEFARTMRHNEPDQMFNVEAIKASSVWN